MSVKITGTRIINLNKYEGIDFDTIEVGVPVNSDEAKKVGLNNVGDVVLPSAEFGPHSKKNVYGFSYPDKSTDKEYRYVTTIYTHPYGNKNASEQPVDISRFCYPLVSVEPYDIYLMLYKNDDGQYFVIADLTSDIRKNRIKEVINLFLEIYGECFLFTDNIIIDEIVRKKCNWEILPHGIWPSEHLKNVFHDVSDSRYKYDICRLKYIEKHKPNSVVEGVNGFRGYYAYIFDKYCVLESAFYGNATYIINNDNWEELSQRTKKELLDANEVVDRIIHKENWKHEMRKYFEVIQNDY